MAVKSECLDSVRRISVRPDVGVHDGGRASLHRIDNYHFCLEFTVNILISLLAQILI